MATAELTQEDLDGIAARRRRSSFWHTFSKNRTAVVGLVLVILVVAASLGAGLITRADPLEQQAIGRLKPPSAEHLLGQDNFGRDVFARILYAGRVSLMVGLGSVLVGLLSGTVLGLLAGYTGGFVETIIMRLVDILMAFPSLLLGLTIMAVLGSGLGNLIFAIGLVLAPGYARIVHATTLSIKQFEYVEAAHCIGATPLRIMFRHILPNIVGEIVVLSSLWTASAIRIEASLSFIGLGISPPTPTWGNMLREGTNQLLSSPWLSIFPGIAIFITVLGFNLMGDGLRDILDPKLKE